jgi:hypothetical protein
MSNAKTAIDQTDEEEIFADVVTDEALEATVGISLMGVSTLAYGSYCFTCVEHPAARIHGNCFYQRKSAFMVQG